MTKITKDNIGSVIRDRRFKAGLTQAELADKVGITAQTVSNIENGGAGSYVNTIVDLFNNLQADLTIEEKSVLVDK